MPLDSSNQLYEEASIPHGTVRVTYIQNGWDGTPSIRLQIREERGHLRQGPEIPIASLGDVVGAAIRLITENHNRS